VRGYSDHIARVNKQYEGLPPDEFSGRVMLIAGAAGGGERDGAGYVGLGHAVARRFAAGGATVVVTDAHPGRTERVTAEIAADYPNAVVVGHALDVSDEFRVGEVIEAVRRDHGPVDTVVNNAVVNFFGTVMNEEPDRFRREVEVNLIGTWNLAHHAMPRMKEAGGGVFIVTSTFAADIGPATEPGYVATKGGVHSLIRSIANEGKQYKIRALAVSMGVLDGSLFALVRMTPDRLNEMYPNGTLKPENVADVIGFLVSDRTAHMTGEVVNVADGIYMRS
jgi:NAD(P)-dependent dehydrogenase (short-subunit alcohol dehydrogenase family)